MTDLEALEIVRDRVRQKDAGSDAELEQAKKAFAASHGEECTSPGSDAQPAEPERYGTALTGSRLRGAHRHDAVSLDPHARRPPRRAGAVEHRGVDDQGRGK